jgi:hypothetical protein
MFKIFMITAMIILAIGWAAYGVWRIITYFTEKNKPKPTTEHLQKVRKSFDEYAKKLQSYERKTYKRE